MKTQLYTNIILTLIAVILAGIAAEGYIFQQDARNVRIVSIVKPPSDEFIKADREHRTIWDPIRLEGEVSISNEPLDVNVANTPLEVEHF